jgi:hypothetical protein
MTVKGILMEYLKEHGFDGLLNTFMECGCGIEDLFPCECPSDKCEPAYKWECVKEMCTGFDPCRGKCRCFRDHKQDV